MLNNIRIVLIKTSHPGNIGSVARAMKTMGLSRLYLVAPKQFPHDKANELASGAIDVLDSAMVVSTLEEAIADCSLVVGTSARSRAIPWPLMEPRAMVDKIKSSTEGQIAILFGCEQSGLSNEELEFCHLHVQIPANPDYSSLNLAAAVQIIAYELRLAFANTTQTTQVWDYPLATVNEMENFFNHLKQVLVELDFLKLKAPRKLMTRMRRFFLRAQPDQMEISMLRGFLKAIQENRDRST